MIYREISLLCVCQVVQVHDMNVVQATKRLQNSSTKLLRRRLFEQQLEELKSGTVVYPPMGTCTSID